MTPEKCKPDLNRRRQLAEGRGWHTIGGPFWNGVKYYLNGFTPEGEYREVPAFELVEGEKGE